MFIAHVDESGDSGEPEKPGTSRTYTLGCVMIDAGRWPEVFDRTISFRRHMRRLFGIPVRAEIKSKTLIRGSGPFETLRLSDEARHHVYRQCLRLMPKLKLDVFGVVVDKQRLKDSAPAEGKFDPEATAWEWLIQRLERRSFYETRPALMIYDRAEEGYDLRVRKAARKARRAGTAGSQFGTGMLHVPFQRLVNDPIPRDSAESYFLQFADLAAYAAFRRLYAPPPRPAQIVPQRMWDELGTARFTAVTKGREPFGIVHNGGPAED
jgi:Protein of unknown function (DUF3800)